MHSDRGFAGVTLVRFCYQQWCQTGIKLSEGQTCMNLNMITSCIKTFWWHEPITIHWLSEHFSHLHLKDCSSFVYKYWSALEWDVYMQLVHGNSQIYGHITWWSCDHSSAISFLWKVITAVSVNCLIVLKCIGHNFLWVCFCFVFFFSFAYNCTLKISAMELLNFYINVFEYMY